MSGNEHKPQPPGAYAPLLFISHEHSDRDIADVIKGFVRHVSGGIIDVYLPSASRNNKAQA